MRPYREQLLAVDTALRCDRGIISAATGSGKSLMMALLINKLQCRTIIITPSLELKRQLSTSMIEWFGSARVGKNKDIYIENVQALDEDEIILGYDLLCIDEFHHSGANTYRKLNKKSWVNIYYRFGFTATPFRNNDNEKILLESVLSDIIYTIDMKKAIELKYICPVEAYYIDLKKIPVKGESWSEVYNELVVSRQDRNLLIAQILINLDCAGESTLCLVKEIAHGNKLSELTKIPFANGQDDSTRDFIDQFRVRTINSLIGTTGILSEGIDTKPCTYVIIAGLGKAKSAFLQQIGRAVRNYSGKESAKIILIKDPSHKWTLTHFKEQAKILKEELGIVPTKLEGL